MSSNPSCGSFGPHHLFANQYNIRAAADGLKVAEVPSFERDRIFGASNLKAVRDGLRVLKTIGEEFINHRRVARASRSRRSGAVVAASIGVGIAAATLTVEGDRAS